MDFTAMKMMELHADKLADRFARRKIVLLTLLAWALIIFSATIMLHFDTLSRIAELKKDPKFAPSLVDTLQAITIWLWPLALLSCLLGAHWAKAPASALKASRLGWLYLALLLFFLPCHQLYQEVLNVYHVEQGLPDLVELLLNSNANFYWRDASFLSLAYASQIAYAYWQKAHHQALHEQYICQQNIGMRLSLLHVQLEPMFLLNTLHGITNLLRQAEKNQAVRAISRLSELLRYVLQASKNDWMTVADEVAFCRDYLDLQMLCFPQRLHLNWQIDDLNWQDYACPSLIIHPLLVQASMHLAEHDRPCILQVHLGKVGERLLMSVDCAQTGTLHATEPEPFADTRTRLHMLFGHQASLHFTRYPLGWNASLQLPLRELADE